MLSPTPSHYQALHSEYLPTNLKDYQLITQEDLVSMQQKHSYLAKTKPDGYDNSVGSAGGLDDDFDDGYGGSQDTNGNAGARVIKPLPKRKRLSRPEEEEDITGLIRQFDNMQLPDPVPVGLTYPPHHHPSVQQSATERYDPHSRYGYNVDGMLMEDKGLPFDPFMSSTYINQPPLPVGFVPQNDTGNLKITHLHPISGEHVQVDDEQDGLQRYRFVDANGHPHRFVPDSTFSHHRHPLPQSSIHSINGINGTVDGISNQVINIERILSRSGAPDPQSSPGLAPSSSFSSDHSEKSSVDLCLSSLPSTVDGSPQANGIKQRSSPSLKTSSLLNASSHARDLSTYCALFSSVDEIVKGVAKAAVATQGGLFGGVDYAGIRKKLGKAPPSSLFDRTLDELDSRDPGSDTNSRVDDRDELRDANGSLQQGGGNKKKRKVPEVSNTVQAGEAYDGYAAVTRPNEPRGTTKDDDGSSSVRSGTKVDFTTPITTLKKMSLIETQPKSRIPLSPGSILQRYRTVIERRSLRSSPPLILSPLTVVQPNIIAPTAQPAAARNPSRAAKAAKKQAQELKAERAKYGGILKSITLPNLYDPNSTSPTTIQLPAIPDKREFDSSSKTSLIPLSDDFTFSVPTSALVLNRMRTLTEQTQKLNRAKARAQEVLKEEAARRLASEKEAAAKTVMDKQVVPAATARKNPVKKTTTKIPDPVPSTSAGHSTSSTPTKTPTQNGAKPKPRPVTTADKGESTPAPAESLKAPPKKGKKKRSALANANNVHHRDNYVPSRLPNSQNQGTHANLDDPNLPGTPGDPTITSTLPSYFAGVDEWLCAFCEYKIFFGEESSLASCIKKRKKVLRIRKRAQERAAKAANGTPSTSTPVVPLVTSPAQPVDNTV